VSTFGIALAAADRRHPVSFDESEQLLAALFTQDIANQRAELVHVLAESSVLRRELNVVSVHEIAAPPRRGGAL
jgi:hypothetical protein